jgi:hypothetical protein
MANTRHLKNKENEEHAYMAYIPEHLFVELGKMKAETKKSVKNLINMAIADMILGWKNSKIKKG